MLVLATGTITILATQPHGTGQRGALTVPSHLPVSVPAPAPATGSATASASPTPRASASAAPSKAPAGRTSIACPLPRHPDASCTGVPAGTALTVVNGGMTITTPNTVIDRKDVRGCIRVQAPGVVIRRSKVSCNDFIVIASFHGEYSGKGLVVEDSDVSCNNGPGTGISDTNVIALRLNIHGCENGFSIDSNFQVYDTYVHDLFNSAETHTDGIEMEGGANITVNHDTLLSGTGGNSAIITDPTKMSNVTISDNLLAGGAYTLFCPRDSSSNVRVLDNRVSRMFYPSGGQYGPWSDCQKVAQVAGNVWDDSGQALAF
ncbi:MAG TPA: hypothetical protein VJT31_25140 [Rugosimonospora sp.]|nr:hypothetical protein [Rugosimonospora sp.]